MFKIRTVVVDYYLSKPIDELAERDDWEYLKQWQEPVIRVFGSTPDGVKSCAHIHGVYPYIYVPYSGGENPERDALLLGAALDEALKTSSKQKCFKFVYKVSHMSGIPLYGYHSKPQEFFKIFFINPFHIRKASELLLSGNILNQKFQPHESHIPYVLQFMMDYNVYGMSFIGFSKVKYRRNPESSDCLLGIDPKDVFSKTVARNSKCYFEVDALAKDITNRHEVGAGANPGLRAIWEDERVLRRAQNRVSQITLQESQSRPEAALYPTESMYLEHLSKKLQEIQEPEAGGRLPLVEQDVWEQDLDTGPGLLQEESEDEANSVLGRNQREDEEVESEEEDMTQPLDFHENIRCRPEADRDGPGEDKSDSDDEFWKSMADKIIQLDGTQDSSSDSEAEVPEKGFSRTKAPGISDSERPTCGSDTEMAPSWSSNIMSILSEDSGCATPSTVCQTPRTFWSTYSPKMDSWLSPGQEAWGYKNEADLADCFSGKSPICDLSNEINSNELYVNLFGSDGGECLAGKGGSGPPMSPPGPKGPVSPPSAILTPASEPDGYSDANLDSVCASESDSLPRKIHASDEEKSSKADGAHTKVKHKKVHKNDEKNLVNALKNFSNSGKKTEREKKTVSLTLKQYIKDCSEIINVDFKNLCNREMVVIEYKSLNRKSGDNKFLIKPLDKFLDHWNVAEKKLNNKLWKNVDKDRERPKIVNGFESTFKAEKGTETERAKLKSLKNKFHVNLSENFLPNEDEEKYYEVNKNVVSRGKIKMKLIKSQTEDEVDECGNVAVGVRKPHLGHRNLWDSGAKKCLKKNEGTQINFLREPRREKKPKNVESRHKVTGKKENSKNKITFSEWDTKLINEINSSFEEYFKNIVKLNSVCGSNENMSTDSEEFLGKDEKRLSEDEDLFKASRKSKSFVVKKRRSQEVSTASEADPVDFVTRFLSAFTQMTQGSEAPPLSVTISLGNPNDWKGMPIQLNFQPAVASPKETNIRKHRRKMKIENVDGAVDSSSEDSQGSDSRLRTSARKRPKREGFYKPLNVIVGGSSPNAKGGQRKRKTFAREVETHKVPSTCRLTDCFSARRKSTRAAAARCEEGKAFGGTSAQSEGDKNSMKCDSPKRESECEPDFIYDSEDEKEFNYFIPHERVSKLRKTSIKKIRRSRSKEPKTSREKTPQRLSVGQPANAPSETSGVEKPPKEDSPRDFLETEEEDKGIVSFYDKSFLSFSQEWEKDDSIMPISKSSESKSSSEKSFRIVDSPKVEELHSGGSQEKSGNMTPAADAEQKPQTTIASSPSSQIEAMPLSGSPLLLSGKNSFSSGGSEINSQTELLPLSCHRQSSQRSQDFNEFEPPDPFFFSDSERSFGNFKNNEVNYVFGAVTIAPKYKPIAKSEVLRLLAQQGMSPTLARGPFYGDPKDATRPLEAGPRVLKIESDSILELKAHKCSLDVSGIEETRHELLELEQKFAGIKRADLLLTSRNKKIVPLKKPPTSKEIIEWLESKNKREKEVAKEKKKIKIGQPSSPGQESDSESEMELSLSASISLDTEEESKKSSAESFQDVRHSRPKSDEVKPLLKKGPLSKIKGIKRMSLLNKLDAIAEEANQEKSSSGSTTRSQPFSGDRRRSADNSFQIRGATLENTLGFGCSVENLQNAKLHCEHQFVTMLVMELHVQTRKDLRPDPQHDPIRALFYTVTFDNPTNSQETGIIVVGSGYLRGTGGTTAKVHYVETETALIQKTMDFVKIWDPDIIAGYEIEMLSWGYFIQRGFVLEMNIFQLLGRTLEENPYTKNAADLVSESGEFDDAPRSIRHLKVTGRIVLDIWRVLRHEIALTSYTFENVMYHLCHERHPLLSFQKLSFCWEHPTPKFRYIVFEHYLTRVVGVVKLLDQLDFVNRTSELSRLFGIQFYEVLSRGSQFRVESMMLRLAKPLNYVPVSPSIAQRAAMRAPASLPLILEPESVFYPDPVIVLDFQSLYPSMIIAYNYCFSTCLGRVEKLGGRGPFEFGCTKLQISPEELRTLEKNITISPMGIAFVKSNVRKGVLPAMLEEILETRLMVKKSMKENKSNKLLQKVLFARQLGLKLIANVTYGYTAANFSGRMPCIEVGDSVVSKGRETLQRAIQLVKNTPRWSAKVVYGDTDSLFVLTPRKTREEAFKIGAEIAEAVTRDNPKPVKLKLEKVYQPCILQTKKRYVGYMYETPDQEKPVFEAKGIETVRRDGCPATAKILQKALQILFDTKDVSLVKKYTIRQFTKLFQGRVNLHDLVFAKEYRGRKGYRPGACVPALQLAKQWTQTDRRAEPRVKERVPYVIVNGPPGVPLIRLVRSPKDLLSDPSLRINAVYYITKAIIPPLQRCFSLLGADVASWYSEVPRKYHKTFKSNFPEAPRRNTLSQYFAMAECVLCSKISNNSLCADCERNPQMAVSELCEKIRRMERCHEGILRICRSCCGRQTELDCQSLDCPVLFRRHQAFRSLEEVPALRDLIKYTF